MRSVLLAMALAAGLGFAALPSASAAPGLGGAVLSNLKASDVITVANGCGPRRHWSWRRHHCVWN